MAVALIFILGGLGACIRFLLQMLWPTVGLSWALLMINVLGSLGIGLLFGKGSEWGISPVWITAIAAGFLGGFTTYSGFTIELVRAAEARQWIWAGTYLISQNVLALFACYVGFHWSRMLT